jgi:hypothetical protein
MLEAAPGMGGSGDSRAAIPCEAATHVFIPTPHSLRTSGICHRERRQGPGFYLAAVIRNQRPAERLQTVAVAGRDRGGAIHDHPERLPGPRRGYTLLVSLYVFQRNIVLRHLPCMNFRHVRIGGIFHAADRFGLEGLPVFEQFQNALPTSLRSSRTRA